MTTHQGYRVPDDGHSRGAPLPTPVEQFETTLRWGVWASARHLHHGKHVLSVETDHSDTLGTPAVTTYAGRPQGWSEQLPDPNALPRTDTRITRSRKGRTSYRSTSRFPVARRPIGTVDGLPVVACEDESHIANCQCAVTLNEASLLAMAEQWVATVDPDGEPLPRVIGYATTRPEMLPGDRSTQAATSDDIDPEDVYIDPHTEYQRALTDALTVRGNERSYGGRYVRETDADGRKRRRWETSYDSIPTDAPIPRPARLCAVSHDDMASFLGIDADSFLGWFRDSAGRSTDTTIADRHRRRTLIPRRGRLGKVARVKADIAVLAETTDERGRKSQLLGRRVLTVRTVPFGIDKRHAIDADAQYVGDCVSMATDELVTFADVGYWLGHRYIAPATGKAVAETTQERTLTMRQALATVRNMAVGETVGDSETVRVTRDDAGWRIGPATYNTPAQAARALLAVAS